MGGSEVHISWGKGQDVGGTLQLPILLSVFLERSGVILKDISETWFPHFAPDGCPMEAAMRVSKGGHSPMAFKFTMHLSGVQNSWSRRVLLVMCKPKYCPRTLPQPPSMICSLARSRGMKSRLGIFS